MKLFKSILPVLALAFVANSTASLAAESYPQPDPEFSLFGAEFEGYVDQQAYSVFEGAYKLFDTGRRWSIVDGPFRISLRCLNKAAGLFNKSLFSPETLKTFNQQKRDNESAQMREALKKNGNPSCNTLAECAGTLVHELIPVKVAEGLAEGPRAGENYGHYKLMMALPFYSGYLLEYVLSQLDRKLGYRDTVLNKGWAKWCERKLVRCRAGISNILCDKSVLGMGLDAEHEVLKVCTKIDKALNKEKEEAATVQPEAAPQEPKISPKLAALLKALADIVTHQADMENDVKDLGSEHALIARLVYLEKKNMLPKGFPDPSELTKENVHQKLDEALKKHLDTLIEYVLSHHTPPNLKKGLKGLLFWLEGKDFLKGVLTPLSAEVALKQLTDPHLFAIAILTARGQETMGLELDKFGRDQEQRIQKIAADMINKVLERQATDRDVLEIFEKSALKSGRGGMEAIEQERDAKAALKKTISEMIAQKVKNKNAPMNDGSKAAAQQNGVGTAALALNSLLDGIVFSLGYMQHLVSERFFDHIADRVVTLIYHPMWRITILSLMDALVDNLVNPQENNVVSEAELEANFKIVTGFVVDDITRTYTQNIGTGLNTLVSWIPGGRVVSGAATIASMLFEKIPYKYTRKVNFGLGNLAAWAAGGKVFSLVKGQIQKPSDKSKKRKSLLEQLLPQVIPTIKELVIYNRVLAAVRAKGVEFRGDAKLWECYVRGYLNRVLKESGLQIQDRKNPVERLYLLHGDELLRVLASNTDVLMQGPDPTEYSVLDDSESSEDFESIDDSVVMEDSRSNSGASSPELGSESPQTVLLTDLPK